MHRQLVVSRGWGKLGHYTVKEGYCLISNIKENNKKDPKWIKIWCKDEIPKINVFFWMLAHRKKLTAENLRKMGMEGPSCCILCKESE